MKKLYAIILTAMLTCLSIPVTANANNDVEEMSELMPMEVINDNENIYIGTPYDENSNEGYNEMTDSNGNKYKFRIRYIKRNSTDLDLYQSQYIANLYRGQTKSVSENYSASRSTSVTWSTSTTTSTSFKLAKTGIDSSISTSLSTNNAESSSYSITKGTTYTFPENAPKDAKYCNLYAGFCHDIYDVVSDYVPYKTHDKLTKVDGINIYMVPPFPHEDPSVRAYKFEICVRLEDGRLFDYEVFAPKHHYREDYNEIPEVNRVLSKYSDGYLHEKTSGYDFASRQVFYGTLRRPIPYEQYVYVY